MLLYASGGRERRRDEYAVLLERAGLQLEGFECPPYDDCLATPSGNGCVPHPCDVDGDCPCGACVNGHCAGRIGAYYEPAS